MSKHRAADTSLTLTPLAMRLAELAAQSGPADGEAGLDAVHEHIAAVADIVREAMDVMAGQQTQADARYAAMAALLQRQTDRVSDVLDAGVRRLESSTEVLASYLEDRDGQLEAERDRVLRDVLEDFAASLHARERRTVARRLIDAVDRRRDARDAARWRREHGAEQHPARPRSLQAAPDAVPRRVIDLDAASKMRRASPRR
ncbi:MAG: hypothetical protein QOG49_47 [Frankiaceae bacterium]|jgi:hypothetical protein|nr:hypothetical protein [Frankiaceae bacterium]